MVRVVLVLICPSLCSLWWQNNSIPRQCQRRPLQGSYSLAVRLVDMAAWRQQRISLGDEKRLDHHRMCSSSSQSAVAEMDSPLGGGSQIGFPRAGSCPVAAICVVCGNNCRVLLSKQKTDHKAQCLLPSGGLHTVNRRRFRVFLLHTCVLGVTPVAGVLACQCHVASVGRCSCYERLLPHLHYFRLLQF